MWMDGWDGWDGMGWDGRLSPSASLLRAPYGANKNTQKEVDSYKSWLPVLHPCWWWRSVNQHVMHHVSHRHLVPKQGEIYFRWGSEISLLQKRAPVVWYPPSSWRRWRPLALTLDNHFTSQDDFTRIVIRWSEDWWSSARFFSATKVFLWWLQLP